MNRRAKPAAAACAGLGVGLGLGIGIGIGLGIGLGSGLGLGIGLGIGIGLGLGFRDRVSGLRPPKRSMPPSIAAAVCAQRAGGVGCVGPKPVDPACAIGPPAVPGAPGSRSGTGRAEESLALLGGGAGGGKRATVGGGAAAGGSRGIHSYSRVRSLLGLAVSCSSHTSPKTSPPMQPP